MAIKHFTSFNNRVEKKNFASYCEVKMRMLLIAFIKCRKFRNPPTLFQEIFQKNRFFYHFLNSKCQHQYQLTTKNVKGQPDFRQHQSSFSLVYRKLD